MRSNFSLNAFFARYSSQKIARWNTVRSPTIWRSGITQFHLNTSSKTCYSCLGLWNSCMYKKTPHSVVTVYTVSCHIFDRETALWSRAAVSQLMWYMCEKDEIIVFLQVLSENLCCLQLVVDAFILSWFDWLIDLTSIPSSFTYIIPQCFDLCSQEDEYLKYTSEHPNLEIVCVSRALLVILEIIFYGIFHPIHSCLTIYISNRIL